MQYGLLDNARRGRLGLSVADYRLQMAELFAPLSKIAAKNPFSSSPVERSVEEIVTVTDDNRMICDPYPRLLVARDQVNQGAAAVMMSVDAARRLGVPEEKWVYVHGHSDMVEQGLLERADLGASPATVHAAQEALRVAQVGVDDIATFDLYSCFPFPVFVACEALGIDGDDPRGLTLTGGLPYFGGPGNSYSLHAIAETVAEMRDKPGKFGFVGANGGTMSKYSVGIYSTLPVDWRTDRSKALQRRGRRAANGSVTEAADGPATVETYSVHYDWPVRTGVIIGRLDADGSRFMALTEDEDLVGLMSDGDPLGSAHRRDVNRARQPRAPGLVPRKQSKVEIDRRGARVIVTDVWPRVPWTRDGSGLPRLLWRAFACGSSNTRAISGLMEGMRFPFVRSCGSSGAYDSRSGRRQGTRSRLRECPPTDYPLLHTAASVLVPSGT